MKNIPLGSWMCWGVSISISLFVVYQAFFNHNYDYWPFGLLAAMLGIIGMVFE